MQDKLTFPPLSDAVSYTHLFLLKTGLCYEKEDGSLRDRFWGRVIFPWFNISGKVLGFGGRVLEDVYKRQHLDKVINYIWLVFGITGFLISMLAMFFWQLPIPVSYTHLDVYKRQQQYKNKNLIDLSSSPERRCSSRTFRYGYLVTT